MSGRQPSPRPGRNPFEAGAGYAVPVPVRQRPGRRTPNAALERAARQLGATTVDAKAAGDADPARVTLRQAARLLGEESFIDRREKRSMRGPWRYRQLDRFGTDEGRLRLVALFERSLTGEEIEPPADVVEAVEHMLAADRVKRRDVPAFRGAADYERYRRRVSG